jgi:hypothetical protein
MKKINKFFFITSFGIHLIFLLLIFFANPRKNIINQHFLILGTHSQMPTQAFFRPTSNIKQTNWLEKRIAQEKAAHEKRLALRKQPQTKINKPKSQIKKASPKQTTISKGIKKELPRKIANNMKKIEDKKEIKKDLESKEEFLEEININSLDETDPVRIACRDDLRSKIAKYWKPPIGIPKGTELLIDVFVDKKGIIKNYKIKQKSEVLLLDLSILKALGMMKNSKEILKKLVHGKKITLELMI